MHCAYVCVHSAGANTLPRAFMNYWPGCTLSGGESANPGVIYRRPTREPAGGGRHSSPGQILPVSSNSLYFEWRPPLSRTLSACARRGCKFPSSLRSAPAKILLLSPHPGALEYLRVFRPPARCASPPPSFRLAALCSSPSRALF